MPNTNASNELEELHREIIPELVTAQDSRERLPVSI